MLYSLAVEQARDPVFYRECAVSDTLDGRFDLIALHVFLILYRLRDEEAAALSQALFDIMFADMDENLRELGVGDLSVGRRVKAMAEALYGRIAAYQAALESDDRDDLAAALVRNLYRGEEQESLVVGAMVDYIRGQAVHLAGQDLAALEVGRVVFLPPSGEIS